MATVENTKITPETWDKKYPLSDLLQGDLWNGGYKNDEGIGYSCVGFARMVLDATYGRGKALTSTPLSNEYYNHCCRKILYWYHRLRLQFFKSR